MTRLVLASMLAVVICACTADDGSGRTPTAIDTPATVSGELEVSVEEGPVGADDLSEINFGSVTTEDGVVLLAIPADVARSSGVTREELVAGGPFDVELVGPYTVADPAAPTYLAGALAAADE